MWIEAYFRMIELNKMQKLKKLNIFDETLSPSLILSGKLLFSSTALIVHLERESELKGFLQITQKGK